MINERTICLIDLIFSRWNQWKGEHKIRRYNTELIRTWHSVHFFKSQLQLIRNCMKIIERAYGMGWTRLITEATSSCFFIVRCHLVYVRETYTNTSDVKCSKIKGFKKQAGFRNGRATRKYACIYMGTLLSARNGIVTLKQATRDHKQKKSSNMSKGLSARVLALCGIG